MVIKECVSPGCHFSCKGKKKETVSANMCRHIREKHIENGLEHKGRRMAKDRLRKKMTRRHHSVIKSGNRNVIHSFYGCPENTGRDSLHKHSEIILGQVRWLCSKYEPYFL